MRSSSSRLASSRWISAARSSSSSSSRRSRGRGRLRLAYVERRRVPFLQAATNGARAARDERKDGGGGQAGCGHATRLERRARAQGKGVRALEDKT